jgi:mono/diheme cytochrome c family protein
MNNCGCWKTPSLSGTWISRVAVVFVVLAFSGLAVTADTADAGKAVFSAYCIKCHGTAGDASTPAGRRLKAADLRSETVQRKSNDELFKGIAYGFGHKQYPHAFAARGLTDKQIADVLAYIRTFTKASPNGKRP